MTTRLLYNGISMNPLFREGDVVEVVPYQGLAIRTGDVVAYPHPEKPGKVIHRVAAVTPQGIITKGDNIPAVDDWTVAPGDILGKVVAIHRQGRILPVPGQAPASLHLLRARHWCDRALSRLLQPAYHRLAGSGLFRGLVGDLLKPKLLCFSRADGPEWQLWLGHLLIGRKLPHRAHWTIRRPFRLLVDEATLPPHASEGGER